MRKKKKKRRMLCVYQVHRTNGRVVIVLLIQYTNLSIQYTVNYFRMVFTHNAQKFDQKFGSNRISDIGCCK